MSDERTASGFENLFHRIRSGRYTSANSSDSSSRTDSSQMTIVPDSSAPHSSGDLDLTRGLVCRAQGGDNEALEKLFAHYLPRTVRIVSLRMGNKLAEFVEY